MGEMTTEVVLKVVQGTNLEVVINRPEALNALSRSVLEELLTLFSGVLPQEVRAIIVTGSGEKAFVAGADVAAMSKMSPDEIRAYMDLGHRVMRAVECCPVPVVAALNGFALGGGLELALACDLIIASDRARVGQPEVNLGVIPGFGGTQRLLHRCGVSTARRLCILGELVPAPEALLLGIVDKVVPSAELMSAARSWGDLIASKGPRAVASVRRVIREVGDNLLLSGLALEKGEFLKLFANEERIEGMSAFLEKRPPRFSMK